jgi:immune inhibitor A
MRVASLALLLALALLTGSDRLHADDQLTTPERLLATPRPVRDSVAIASRLSGQQIPWTTTTPQAVPLSAGRRDTFYDLDQTDNNYKPHEGILRLVSTYAYWYVQADQRVTDDDLASAARTFDEQIVPVVHRAFGEEWNPGIDGDPRVTIFLGTAPGVSAYFSSADELPKNVFRYSNEREMIHVNLGSVRPGSATFNGTLAHEFQHLVHWHLNPSTETWLDEGLAELASSLAVPERSPGTGGFQRQPDVPLTAWSQSGQTSLHYQASYLFAHYFAQRFGGEEATRRLLTEPGRPPDTITASLSRGGYGVSFDDVFEDWLVANLLDDPSVGDGRFAHDGIDHKVSPSRELWPAAAPIEDTVHQYGADYIELRSGGPADLVFEGAATVPLVDATPTSGRSLWWSNRADGLDSTLTRRVDLTGVTSATLRFNVWYETERDFDFVYVLASTDQGTTWRVLQGAHAANDDTNGYALGPGYTGKSGVERTGAGNPSWIAETVDLSSLAGRDVLVRFEYVTDQGFNLRGALLDDITIPEIGFLDDAESDAGWTADGFLRSDNTIPQTWSLQLVERGSDGITTVRALRPDADGKVVQPIPSLGTDERAVLVVSGLAPRTLETARFRASLRTSAGGG